ncbi:hypothetical protein PG984_010161 [Apiospora sp. TS-2023a]
MVEDQSRLDQTAYEPKAGTPQQAEAHWEALCRDCELRLAKIEKAVSLMRCELGYYSMLRNLRRWSRQEGGRMDSAEYWALRDDVGNLEAWIRYLKAGVATELMFGSCSGSAGLRKIALELEELGKEVSDTQVKFQTSEKS